MEGQADRELLLRDLRGACSLLKTAKGGGVSPGAPPETILTTFPLLGAQPHPPGTAALGQQVAHEAPRLRPRSMKTMEPLLPLGIREVKTKGRL